jgi:hypothetical protein
VEFNENAIAREVEQWFFSEYLSTWVTIGASQSADPRGVLDYWGVPMHAASPRGNRWLMTDEAVLGLLEANHKPLKAAGYTHTAVLDRALTAYNENAVSIEVLWSRRRADESEIERLATHFEIHRTGNGWRMVALASAKTPKDSLAEVWRRRSGSEIGG